MWIQESVKKGNKMRDHFSMSGVDVYIKDRLPDHIDLGFVFEYISSRVPFYFLKGISNQMMGLICLVNK